MLGLSAIALTHCSEREPALPPCPDRYLEDPGLERRLLAALGATERGRDLLRRAGATPRICFGEPAEPSITTDRVVLLDARHGEGESAARLGHLLLHAIEGLPMEAAAGPDRPCDERVAEAVRAEARAHALELELRRDLGVTSTRTIFAFEDAFWSAPPDRRVEVIRAWLEANPRGGGGVPGFVEAYGRACRGDR